MCMRPALKMAGFLRRHQHHQTMHGILREPQDARPSGSFEIADTYIQYTKCMMELHEPGRPGTRRQLRRLKTM